MDRLDLCAHGFYSTPDVTGFGGDMPFNYFCYGVCVWRGGGGAGGALSCLPFPPLRTRCWCLCRR
jgi:hypothetical protein